MQSRPWFHRTLAWMALSFVALHAGAQAPASGAGERSAPLDKAEVRQWLLRIHEAAQHRNFQGTFVVSAGGQMASSRIAHYCEGGSQYERIDSLDGPPRQVFRHNDVVHTVWPQSRVVVVEQRDSRSVFPALLLNADEQIFVNYEVRQTAQRTTAGHTSFWAYVGPLIWGTLFSAIIALILGAPIAIGIALFISHYAPRRLAGVLGYLVDLLAAVPSVVFGLWGIFVIRPFLIPFQDWLNQYLGWIPLFSGPVSRTGSTMLAGGVVLAVMILPIITSISREVFDTVPRNDKEGALALGATRSEMISGVVIPHSLGGLTGAVMLGLGRAMGETIAVSLLIGGVSNPPITIDILSASDAMPSAIARKLPEASGDFRAALIGLGVTLFVITMVVNVASRRFVDLVDRRIKGAA